MKKTLILLIIMLLRIYGYSQNHEIDSLKQVVNNQKNDTNKVNTLVVLAKEVSQSNPDSGIIIATQALQLAKGINWQMGVAMCHSSMGDICLNMGDFSLSLVHFTKVVEVYENLEKSSAGNLKSKIIKFKSRTLRLIGIDYEEQGDYPKALDYDFRALKMDEGMANKLGIASNLDNIGDIYVDESDYAIAQNYFFRALKIAEQIENKILQKTILGNIATVYEYQGDSALAAGNKKLALEDKYPKAMDYSIRVQKMDSVMGEKSGDANNLSNIGSIYDSEGNYPKALDCDLKSLNIYKDAGDKFGVARNLNNIGFVYFEQNNFSEADKFLHDALKLATEIKALDLVQASTENLSKLYSKEENSKSAFEYYKQFIAVRDTINNEEKAKKQTRLEMNYEFGKKQFADSLKVANDKGVEALKLQKQKLATYGGFTGLFIVAGGLILVFRQRNRISKEKKRSDELLLNILPAETAEELKQTGRTDAKMFDVVTVMFTDFKGFTQISEKLLPAQLVAEIDCCFSAFDNIIAKYGVEKIKTIGDSYMCAGGLPVKNITNPNDVIKAALEIRDFMANHNKEKEVKGEPLFEIRIGVHTGPVVAGIVGVKKFAYDIWGDTVNIASRMESSGEAGKVNISGSTYELVKNDFACSYRGKIQAKHKGEVDMFFVSEKSTG